MTVAIADELALRPTPKLRTVRPNKTVKFPVIVLAGEQGSGKSYAIAAQTGNDRFGQSYWLEWGAGDEGIGHEYANVPGADHLVIQHDGTWNDIMGQIQAAKEQARADLEATGKPSMLVIDSISAAWEQIKTWTYRRAMRSKQGRKTLESDPNAAVDVGRNLWNDARARYRELMTQLLTFPGVVVVTARAKEVSGTDDAGRPTTAREWKIECHESLPYDATVVIRMDTGAKPVVTKLRSGLPGIGVDPATSKPQRLDTMDMGWMVFDHLGCQPGTAAIRQVTSLDSDEIPEATEASDGQQQYRPPRVINQQQPPRQPESQPSQDWKGYVRDAVDYAADDWAALIESARPDTTAVDMKALMAAVAEHRPTDEALMEWLRLVFRHEAARQRDQLPDNAEAAEAEAADHWSRCNELETARARVWADAQTAGWTGEKLAADYQQSTGTAIGDATAEELERYRTEDLALSLAEASTAGADESLGD